MTTRMTVALAILTLGLAVAALAGIPAFIENREVGDIAMLIGFAVAVVGLLLVILAIPGQRKQNGAIKTNVTFEIEQLRVERRRLKWLLQNTQQRMSMHNSMRSAASMLTGPTENLRTLQLEIADLTAELEKNAIELRRRGADPDAD